jgi:RNA polymerase sigma-70 factor (ECF subfamily)
MPEPVSDASLLERFVRGREEAAFRALVRRHGPLVERICRRILRDEHDVEDVLQVTFLVLARKAATIPWRDSVGGWLSAVAHRLAWNLRSGKARQRGRETPITALRGHETSDAEGRLPERYHPIIEPSGEVERRDLRRVLDDELLRLPEKYRAPVVLCDLEGHTHEEAARRLGWPTGSMSRRLDRARRLLRRRLVSRGVAFATIGLVFAAAVVIGTGRVLERPHRSGVGREAMHPFRPASEGGQGLALTLAALVRPDAPPPGIDQIARLAHESARAADRLQAEDPARMRDRWRQSASAMRQAALELALASRDTNPLALLTAARRLDASCLKCHEVFNQ